VLSDHGFAPYYQSFHLNSWLLDNGYATAIPGKDREHAEFFEAIDWARTRAYGLGFNALYLNLAGREGNGIVNENEKARLLDEIVTKLQAVRDPANGAQPIPFVYKTSEVYHGPYGADAPDLIIGYNLGYRCSWESAIGKYPSGLFKPNTKLWSGDHCMAYELVPGIILSNRKISSAKPYLYDLAPSILDLFKIAKDPAMTGNNLFR
jgi:predicted AlkP superfamily phosphohydrolase/phosphomutase